MEEISHLFSNEHLINDIAVNGSIEISFKTDQKVISSVFLNKQISRKMKVNMVNDTSHRK